MVVAGDSDLTFVVIRHYWVKSLVLKEVNKCVG